MSKRKRRRADVHRKALFPEAGLDRPLGTGGESTRLHEERLDTVTSVLRDTGARTVLDLGCGGGSLLKRLAEEDQFTRIVGIDTSIEALVEAERSLGAGALQDERVSLRHAGFDTPDADLTGFDAAAMVETIEHIEPERLSIVERVVFAEWRPRVVVMTTPNREYNSLLGLEAGEPRHPDHRFEWDRQKFGSWAEGVAQRHGYEVRCDGIGPADPLRGCPTQIAVFRLPPARDRPNDQRPEGE
ncbi:MAG TPA: methyltransferase [Longimicrobiaceae bacterium]|nr:methyltransferase [Longimicrobiaceae bacterium]